MQRRAGETWTSWIQLWFHCRMISYMSSLKLVILLYWITRRVATDSGRLDSCWIPFVFVLVARYYINFVRRSASAKCSWRWASILLFPPGTGGRSCPVFTPSFSRSVVSIQIIYVLELSSWLLATAAWMSTLLPAVFQRVGAQKTFGCRCRGSIVPVGRPDGLAVRLFTHGSQGPGYEPRSNP